MSEKQTNSVFIADKFAVAEVALYIFAVLQVVTALMMAAGVVPLGLAQQATTMQRVTVTTNAVFNILGFTVGYILLARSLKQCTKLVWRLAFALFLTNVVLSFLATFAQPGPYHVLTCCLSIAGLVSLWNGRRAVSD